MVISRFRMCQREQGTGVLSSKLTVANFTESAHLLYFTTMSLLLIGSVSPNSMPGNKATVCMTPLHSEPGSVS